MTDPWSISPPFRRAGVSPAWALRTRGPDECRLLWKDFQRRNLVPFELEQVSKINGAAGKVPSQVAGDDCLPVLLFARERLAGVLKLCRGARLPLFDCRSAFVSVPLVLHDGIFSKAL